MSPSVLEYESRHELFRDSDLFALVAVLEHFLEQGKVDAGLGTIVSAWKRSCIASGPGTIEFDFSLIEANAEFAEKLRTAMAWMETEIQRLWADSIPATILNRYDPSVIKFAGFPVERLNLVIRRVRRVIGDGDDPNAA